MSNKASALSRPSVRESMEDMAPAEATWSSGQDFLASQREIRKLTFEKHTDNLKADRAERDKQRAREYWQTAQQRLEEDLRVNLRHMQKDRQGTDEDLIILMDRYEELLQGSSEEIEKLECERNQALVDRDRAVADKEQALADKEQALADKQQALADRDQAVADKNRAIAGREQATVEASSLEESVTRQVDHVRRRMDKLTSQKRQRDRLIKTQKCADRDLMESLKDVEWELEASKYSGYIPQSRITVLRTRSVQEGNSADLMVSSHQQCNTTKQSESSESIDERCTGFESDGLARDGLCTISVGLDKIVQKMEVSKTSDGMQASSQARIDRQADGGGNRCSSFGATSPLASSTSVIPNQDVCEGSRSDHRADAPAREDSNMHVLSSAASQPNLPQFNEHRTGPAVASSLDHFSDDAHIQTGEPSSHGTQSIVTDVSRDSSHLNEPYGNGTVYWFRDVVHGAIHGQTNHASADAVRYEVECFLDAGIRPEQITVVAWSPGQTGLIKGKLRQINPLIGRADDVHVVFVEDFGDRESDIIIADSVMADERTHHSNHVSQKGDAKDRKATQTRKTLMARAKDSINLEIGFAQATYGFVMIGQSNWLMRWPKFKGVIDKHPYAELVRDAWRRKVHIRDTTHRDTHPNVVQKNKDLGSVEVSRRAAVADEAHLNFFERLINAGPKISRVPLPKKNKQAAALQRARADADRAMLQQRAAERQQIEEDDWQEAHGEGDS